VRREDVPAEAIEKEKAIYRAQMEGQNKPANVIDKIVESGLKTYYKEVCLLDQAYIRDDKKSVAQVVKEAEKDVGAPIKLTGFVRYALGEGIDRPDSDFSSEVAAMSGQH
jgi:elongation factor Ts